MLNIFSNSKKFIGNHCVAGETAAEVMVVETDQDTALFGVLKVFQTTESNEGKGTVDMTFPRSVLSRFGIGDLFVHIKKK
jgi:hypothetical protein